MTELTGPQSKFADELVSAGCTPTEAARRAGYADPSQEAWRLLRKPHVIAAVREMRERLISGSLANIAAETLREVMTNQAYPASARVSAARVVFEAAGHFQRVDRDAEMPLNEMSEAELTAFIARQDQIIASGGAPLTIKVVEPLH